RHGFVDFHLHAAAQAVAGKLCAVDRDPECRVGAGAARPGTGDGRVAGREAFDFHLDVLAIPDADDFGGDRLAAWCGQRHTLGPSTEALPHALHDSDRHFQFTVERIVGENRQCLVAPTVREIIIYVQLHGSDHSALVIMLFASDAGGKLLRGGLDGRDGERLGPPVDHPEFVYYGLIGEDGQLRWFHCNFCDDGPGNYHISLTNRVAIAISDDGSPRVCSDSLGERVYFYA